LVDLLQSWIEEGDAQEQKETGEYLIRAWTRIVSPTVASFPPELKGVTW
jgi:hypothetical protein